jgi:hypothetical protein
MTDKKPVTARLPPDMEEKLEDYAEEKEISKSDTLRRMIQKGLELEEAGVTVASSTEPKNEEKEPVPDGGYVSKETHRWVEPLLGLVQGAAKVGIFLVIVAMIPPVVVYYTGIPLTGNTAFLSLALYGIFAVLAAVSVLFGLFGIVVLEFLLPKEEAPIRRLFYSGKEPKEATA